MSLTMSALLEHVANIKTFSLVNCCHNCRAKLVSTVEKFFGMHLDLVDPYNVATSRLFSDFIIIIIIITSLFIEDYILSTCKYLSNIWSS